MMVRLNIKIENYEKKKAQEVKYVTSMFGEINIKEFKYDAYSDSIFLGNRQIALGRLIPSSISLEDVNFELIIDEGVRPVIDIVIGADIRVSGFINIPVTGTMSCNCINLI